MVKSKHIIQEYDASSTDITLNKVTSLAVVNTGDFNVDINGYELFPRQKTILVPGDQTFSDVNLKVKYKEDVGRKTILVIYKKLD